MWPLSCLERRCSAVSNEIVKAYAGDLCITSRSSTALRRHQFFFCAETTYRFPVSKGRWTSKDGESSRSVWIVHRLQSNPWPFLFSDNIALASSLYTRASMSHCAWRSHLVFFAARRCIAFRRAKICIRKEESVGEGFVFRSHRIRRTFVIRHRHSRLLEL
ncbi:hypothetical protein EDD18DRAFT_1221717, partial [Armillaria luteobubalina]